jgi:hypothetical protein
VAILSTGNKTEGVAIISSNAKKKMRTILFLYCCFFVPLLCFSQKENNIWYFGNHAGVDFTSGTPVALTNSAMYTYEGSATICDSIGSLLFYTNGGQLYDTLFDSIGAVWNRNHSVMPNGVLNHNGGCFSSIQSSLIIPNPGHPREYYLFTTDCWEHQMAGGLRYSIIDMSLDAGLGDVTVKGIPVLDSVVESLYAIERGNGNGYWVITHKIDNTSFYTFQITSTGISPPVITNIGLPVHYGGQITASIDGRRIGYGTCNHTMLFNFDNATGILSNFIDLNKASIACAFSANCRFFYEFYPNTQQPSPPLKADSIYQYDLSSGNVPASALVIASPLSYFPPRGEMMQLAPDGKIYIATRKPYLDVINSPDLPGSSCNYVVNGLYLGGYSGDYCLPNIVNSFYGECSLITGVESSAGLLSDNVIISPNPFHNSACIEFNNIINKPMHLSVFDSYGRLVRSIDNITTDKIIFKRQDLPCGIFFFQLRTDKIIIRSGKFIIE